MSTCDWNDSSACSVSRTVVMRVLFHCCTGFAFLRNETVIESGKGMPLSTIACFSLYTEGTAVTSCNITVTSKELLGLWPVANEGIAVTSKELLGLWPMLYPCANRDCAVQPTAH